MRTPTKYRLSRVKLWVQLEENKKGMGVSTSAHPCTQAFALPHFKDKQRSQPTPVYYIATLERDMTVAHNSPNGAFPLHYLCEVIQSCEV